MSMQRSSVRGDEAASTKRRLLEALKRYGPKTARELAKFLGGGPVAMRVHLRNLGAAGLVRHSEEHQRVGRPVRRFSLTAEADALFAKRYDQFAVKLVEGVFLVAGQDVLRGILRLWEQELVEALEPRLAPDAETRPESLVRYLSEAGFMPSLEAAAHGLSLIQRNCPISQISARFPLFCQFEAALFARILERPVELTACMATGDDTCSFALRRAATLGHPASVASSPAASAV
jgi:predicted ArsR family transcriptional regulator